MSISINISFFFRPFSLREFCFIYCIGLHSLSIIKKAGLMDPNGSQWIPMDPSETERDHFRNSPCIPLTIFPQIYLYIYIYRWLVLYSPCWSNQIYGHSGSLTQKNTLAVWLCCSFQAAEENSMLSSLFDELLGGSTIWIDDD